MSGQGRGNHRARIRALSTLLPLVVIYNLLHICDKLIRNEISGIIFEVPDVPVRLDFPTPAPRPQAKTTEPSTARPSTSRASSPPSIIVSQNSTDYLRRLSSVDYMACCGAGHRISKTAEANYFSKLLGLSLRVFWGYCDTTEVYNHLFGPEPVDTNRNTSSVDHYLRVHNNVRAFQALRRRGPRSECLCHNDKNQEDYRYYSSLRNRFRGKQRVDSFRAQHFTGDRTIIGLHIRAGNGETGDFEKKKRGIVNVDRWLSSVLQHIRSRNWTRPTLFVATDTLSMIHRLQQLGDFPVLQYNQSRINEGSGILFGAQGNVQSDGVYCLEDWENAFADMMLLTHADVVIAARPSSFTQSLPLSMVLGRSKEKRFAKESAFCELTPSAERMKCYEDMQTWCCQGRTVFSLKGIQPNDYLRVPRLEPFNATPYLAQLQDRNVEGEGCIPKDRNHKQTCLPWNWSEHQIVVEP